MRIHAIQTGTVRIKTAQVEGRGHGLRRQLAIIADANWTEWLPTYAWAIEHREGSSSSTPAKERICSKPGGRIIPM
jgi:hypothetical protein